MIELYTDEFFMREALKEAQKALEISEVPVGAVVVCRNRVIARAHNQTEKLTDATAHAEMLVIRNAAAELGAERLDGADLYVTLEPCTMCAAAISFARLRRLYFGAKDEKGGAVLSGVRFFGMATCHHAPEVYSGLDEQRSAALLQDFFRQRRGH